MNLATCLPKRSCSRGSSRASSGSVYRFGAITMEMASSDILLCCWWLATSAIRSRSQRMTPLCSSLNWWSSCKLSAPDAQFVMVSTGIGARSRVGSSRNHSLIRLASTCTSLPPAGTSLCSMFSCSDAAWKWVASGDTRKMPSSRSPPSSRRALRQVSSTHGISKPLTLALSTSSRGTPYAGVHLLTLKGIPTMGPSKRRRPSTGVVVGHSAGGRARLGTVSRVHPSGSMPAQPSGSPLSPPVTGSYRTLIPRCTC
mmetsp:Transcript_31041/g.72149  ORF Transcript_31041/g.72149 Transcript_31041/m.72149 type:complete len:256 (+) Transcript_31041:104-871(+)